MDGRYISTETRDRVFHATRNACAVCASVEYLELVHMRPASLGGLGLPENLIALCLRCRHNVDHLPQLSVDDLVKIKHDWECENIPGAKTIEEMYKKGKFRLHSHRAPAISLMEFDVAISFAGADRSVARELAQKLTLQGLRVFFDEFHQAELWGADLYAHLSEKYEKKSRFCIVLISRHYAENVWTKHELRAAQARALNENREFILPIRLDDTQLEGLLPTIAYMRHPETSMDEISQLVTKKAQYYGRT